MLIPRFWARADGAATDREGRRLALRLWETTGFLNGFAADPAFVTLCRLQASFRARLTPKPWRCDVPAPPGQHPRDPATQSEFAAWLLKYETASRAYATCAFVDAFGSAPPDADGRAIVDEHDRVTRAMEKLPMA